MVGFGEAQEGSQLPVARRQGTNKKINRQCLCVYTWMDESLLFKPFRKPTTIFRPAYIFHTLRGATGR